MKGRFAGKRKAKKHAKSIIKLALLPLILCAAVIYLDSKIRPVVKGMAESAASIISANVVNQAVYDCLATENEQDEIILLDKDSDGDVVAIHSNIAKINRLKARITTAVQNELMKHTDGAVSVPLGNFTGIDFLSGRGPDITIKYKMSSSVQTAISSELTGAAINQSRHRIMLNVTTSVYIMMPAFNTSTSSTTSYCIAETVIVGDTPNSYAEMTDDLMNGPSILE